MMWMRSNLTFGVVALLFLGTVPFAAGLAPARVPQAAPQEQDKVAGQARGRSDSRDDAKQAVAETATAMHFATFTISIDPQGQTLAAYQFEIRTDESFVVVGLDNAGHEGFSDPPYYDLEAAVNGTDRLIVADFSLLPPEDLSSETQRIAVIHAAFTLEIDADLDALASAIMLTLSACADPDGNPIDADISFDLHFAQRQEQE